MDILDRTQADQDREIASLDKEVTKCQNNLMLCSTKSDASEMWKFMERFTHYDELRHLNNKFLPELAKAEQQILNFQNELEKQRIIIR